MSKKQCFETDDFAQVNAQWREILKNEGFDDLEDTRYPDKFIQPEILSTRSKYRLTGSEHEKNRMILETYGFRRDMDKAIFEQYSDGKSTREIEKWLATRSYKPLTWMRIHQIITKIKNEFEKTQ